MMSLLLFFLCNIKPNQTQNLKQTQTQSKFITLFIHEFIKKFKHKEDKKDEEQVFVPSPLLSLKEQIEKDKGPFHRSNSKQFFSSNKTNLFSLTCQKQTNQSCNTQSKCLA
jgi:hypothetical protein